MKTMRKTYSLSAKLSANLLIMTTLILVGVVLVIGALSYKYIREDAIKRSIDELRAVKEEMNTMVERNEYSLRSFTWLISENLDNDKFMSRMTHNIMVANEVLEGCALISTDDSATDAICSYRTDSGVLRDTVLYVREFNSIQKKWLEHIVNTATPLWGDPFYEMENGRKQLHINYFLPVFDSDGRIVAVLATKMCIKGMTDMLMSMRPYENSYNCMLDKEMVYASYPDSADVLSIPLSELPPELHEHIIAQQKKKDSENTYSSISFRTADGEKNFAVLGLFYNNWYVMTVSNHSDVFSTLIKINRAMISVSLFMLLMLLIVTRRTVRRFTQPLTQFTFSALNVSKGNFDVSIPDPQGSSELIRLRGAMTNMLSAIRNYIRELKTSVAANEKYESELNIAKKIQHSMLPTDFPRNDKVDVFATLTPAKEVGGDLYDFRLTEEKMYFVVGDVSGKGVPAALFMAITREAFKFVGNLGLDIHKIIGRINNAFCDGNSLNMFITLFAGSCELKTGKMRFCNAGHNPILVIPPDGKAYFLRAKPNLAAGLLPDFPYEKEEIVLESGTRLLLYTDGVTEAEAADKSQFGEERLLAYALSKSPDTSSEEFVTGLEAAVHEFAGANPQNDDITILSIKFNTEFTI